MQLIDHIVRTSTLRDRTEINAALADAMEDLFHPLALTIYRCFSSERKSVVFSCAGLKADGPYSRNAYLPQRKYCRPLENDPVIKRCWQDKTVLLDRLPDDSNRLLFPVIQFERVAYIVDVTVPSDFPAEKRVALMSMVEYFSNHTALLDYGETDTLTGLANRKTFDKHLFEVLGQAAADDMAHSADADLQRRRKGGNDNARHWLAVCDIDHFKSINDTFGHLIGDETLVVLSQIMRQSFRFDDQLFRFGGEEFVVVLQPTTRENAFNALDRFRKNIESHVFSRIGQARISVGFSQLLPNDTPPDVIERADEALYYAKQHGRNQVASYETLIESGLLQAKNDNKGDIELF